MTIYTNPHRRPVDPVAHDHELGQKIGMLDIEIQLRVADLHADNERIARLRKVRERLINERLDLLPETRDVELLRLRSQERRGMRR